MTSENDRPSAAQPDPMVPALGVVGGLQCGGPEDYLLDCYGRARI